MTMAFNLCSLIIILLHLLHTAATLSKFFGGLSSPIRSRGGANVTETEGVSLISKKALPSDFATVETLEPVHNPHSNGEIWPNT